MSKTVTFHGWEKESLTTHLCLITQISDKYKSLCLLDSNNTPEERHESASSKGSQFKSHHRPPQPYASPIPPPAATSHGASQHSPSPCGN
jgi:hypothetical protein